MRPHNAPRASAQGSQEGTSRFWSTTHSGSAKPTTMCVQYSGEAGAPGHYRLHVSVNLIAKSSCGGVKAVTLLDREVTLDVQ